MRRSFVGWLASLLVACVCVGCCKKAEPSPQGGTGRFVPSGAEELGSSKVTWLGRCAGSDALAYRVELRSAQGGNAFEARALAASPEGAEPAEPPKGAFEHLDWENPPAIQFSDLVSAPFLRCTFESGSTKVGSAIVDKGHLRCVPSGEETAKLMFGSCTSTEFFLASDVPAAGS